MRKHKRYLATSWKPVSVEINKALCEPILASCEAKLTPSESMTVSTETKMTLYNLFLLHVKLERLYASLR